MTIVTITVDGLTYFGDIEEWDALCKIVDTMHIEHVIGILEHYDLENWL